MPIRLIEWSVVRRSCLSELVSFLRKYQISNNYHFPIAGSHGKSLVKSEVPQLFWNPSFVIYFIRRMFITKDELRCGISTVYSERSSANILFSIMKKAKSLLNIVQRHRFLIILTRFFTFNTPSFTNRHWLVHCLVWRITSQLSFVLNKEANMNASFLLMINYLRPDRRFCRNEEVSTWYQFCFTKEVVNNFTTKESCVCFCPSFTILFVVTWYQCILRTFFPAWPQPHRDALKRNWW